MSHMTTKNTIISDAPLIPLVQEVRDCGIAWTIEDAPLRCHFEPGHPKVLFVAGENCSGKSYFVETLRSWCQHLLPKATTISISIRERTGAGEPGMSNMKKVMIFGSEESQSTGATSASVVKRAFENLPSRTRDGYQTLLVLDEPEMGLSESYSCAMGSYIAQCCKEAPEGIAGIVVVSHSKGLAAKLSEGLGQIPSFVHMGAPLSFTQWQKQKEVQTVESLLALEDTGFLVRDKIWALERELLSWANRG